MKKNMQVPVTIIAASALLTFVGCATQSKYVWGNYESALFAYYKNPANAEKLKEELSDAIEKGEKTGRIAPGMYAEFGYLLLESGDFSAAKTYFEKEKAKWPESAALMEKLEASCSQHKDVENSQITPAQPSKDNAP